MVIKEPVTDVGVVVNLIALLRDTSIMKTVMYRKRIAKRDFDIADTMFVKKQCYLWGITPPT